MRLPRLLAALLLLGLLVPPAVGAGREIHGRVLDRDGEPVAGIEVATFWTADGDGVTARQVAVTDEEGAFTAAVRWVRRTRSLMALDREQRRGAIVHLEETALEEGVELRLEPLGAVRGTLSCPELGRPIERSIVSVTALPAQIAVLSLMTTTDVSLDLPPGEYHLRIAAADCVRVRRRITLSAEAPDLDLGTIPLEPTIIARHYGREPPPLHVTDARGTDKEATLADWKGKWVLLEFWAHW